MIDLQTTNNDNLYKLFHSFELNTDVPYLSYITNKLQNMLHTPKNMYCYNCFSDNFLKIILANVLYYFNSKKKIIILYKNDKSLDEYYFIFQLNKYFNIFIPSEIDDILSYEFDIMITDVNNLTYSLNYFSLPENDNYVILHEMNNPYIFDEQTLQLFDKMNLFPDKFQYILYSPYISNSYKRIVSLNNIVKIDLCNYSLKNNLFVCTKYPFIYDNFTYILENKNLSSSIIFIHPFYKDSICEILNNNDICYNDLDLITNFVNFNTNIGISKCYRFHILTNPMILFKMIHFFENIFIFHDNLCINKLRELAYYDENIKNIYFLHDNKSMFDNINKIYNNRVKRI